MIIMNIYEDISLFLPATNTKDVIVKVRDS